MDDLHCARLVKIRDVNQTSLAFFNTQNRKDLVEDITAYFSSHSIEVFKEEIIALAEGKKDFNAIQDVIMPSGEIKKVNLFLNVVPGFYDTLGRVLVSWTDISDRLKY